MTVPPDRTGCVIAGGGPAGMMLGFLLARAGIDVTVVEKHADFLRDFRGDTLHPSTLEVMHELGLFEELAALPHQKVAQLSAAFGDVRTGFADFSHLPVRSPYIMLMPQWDFLDFLRRKGEDTGRFRCLMETQAIGVKTQAGRVAALTVEHRGRQAAIEAPLVIGADGRRSTVREAAGLEVEDLGAPIDVLWFRLSRSVGDSDQTGGRFDLGRLFIRINRGDYWQCAMVIPKGSGEAVRARGIEAFRAEVAALGPFSAERMMELESFDDVALLDVRVDRLKRWWRPGLLCIGDAAHAMSPVGGIGINLAIQDAVATANLLWRPLREGQAGDGDLAAVEKRRLFPTRLTQAGQVFVHRRILTPALSDAARPMRSPLPVRLLARFPLLRRIPARLVGMGVRPEHVKSPA